VTEFAGVVPTARSCDLRQQARGDRGDGAGVLGKAVPCGAAGSDDGFAASKTLVADRFAQILTEVFDRVQLRAAGRQGQEREIAADDKRGWPKGRVEPMAAVRNTLVAPGGATLDQVALQVIRGRKEWVLPLLQWLAGVVLARPLDTGGFAATSS